MLSLNLNRNLPSSLHYFYLLCFRSLLEGQSIPLCFSNSKEIMFDTINWVRENSIEFSDVAADSCLSTG